MSVVGVNKFCDGVAAGICKWNRKFLSIQMNSSQRHVFRDISEVDRERALLNNSS